MKGTWIYSGLFTLYLLANMFQSGFASQLWDVSYYIPVPTNLMTIISFAISGVAFICWEALK